MIESPSGGVPAKVPRWDLEEQRLAAAEKVFLVSPRWFGNILEFIAKELGQEVLRGAHKPARRALGGCPPGLWAPRDTS